MASPLRWARPSAAPPLHVTVRFLDLPDVQIHVADPGRVTVVGLKTLIRARLRRAAHRAAGADTAADQPAADTPSTAQPTVHDAHRRRLRILYYGKSLADDDVLGTVLQPVHGAPFSSPSPVPRPASAVSTPPAPLSSRGGSDAHETDDADETGKTDGRDGRDGRDDRDAGADDTAPRVYVSCSLGDVLPDRALAAEAEAAAAAAAAAVASTFASPSSSPSTLAGARTSARGGRAGLRRDIFHHSRVGGGSASARAAVGSETAPGTAPGTTPGTDTGTDTTTPPPRGFERLLQAGFSAAEVNQLRLQFRSIQATRFTPDTMPSPDSLRSMEDNWLDNNQGGGTGSSGSGGSGPGSGGGPGAGGDEGGAPSADDTGLPGLLDTMVWAMLIGFLFPLGSTCWLAREDGLWTPRWRMFASLGVMVSLMIGMVKSFAGEW